MGTVICSIPICRYEYDPSLRLFLSTYTHLQLVAATASLTKTNTSLAGCHRNLTVSSKLLNNWPEIQKPAPEFSGTAVVQGDFKEIKLSDYKGKYVVLFFYPLDLYVILFNLSFKSFF